MNIELIKPETQAKLRKPVLISVGILLALGCGWLVMHSITTADLTANEYIDKTSGTIVDTYTGAGANGDTDNNLIYGIESIEDNIPSLAYGELETVAERFVTYAYPSEQFSYRKDSFKKSENEDGEETGSFEISSSKRHLSIQFTTAEDKLIWLEILSGKSVIYSYNK